jgi:hypothetical protein
MSGQHTSLAGPRWAALAFLALSLCVAQPAAAATEVHGMTDAFAGNGVAIAWGTVRGASEETTFVVLRVAVEPGRYARIAAEGIDPFTKEKKALVAPRALSGTIDLRIARKSFGDFPRTEVAFFDDRSGVSAPPALVVYYLGVPDTTPEFASESALGAYLSDRIAKLAPGGPAKGR